MTDSKCPCGANKTRSDCCELYISGKESPSTPEALMRSRYTAYTQANIDYIQKTMRGPAAVSFDADEARRWAEQAEWIDLTVIDSSVNQAKGMVEFIARYRINQQVQEIHERSEFQRVDHSWYYVSGCQVWRT